MPPPQAPRAAAYLDALALQIEKKLQRALASALHRRNLLQELFADIALEVDDRAREMIFREEDAISEAEDRYGCPLCFYNVLADYFVCMPQNGKSILDLVVQLWSQSLASNIFPLLFHKWMFEVQFDNPEVLLRYSSALVQGATNVFWIDIQTNARHFSSLFHYLLEEVALDSEISKKIPCRLSEIYFFSSQGSCFSMTQLTNLKYFLNQFPDFPNAFLIGGASDIFVTELADQLQKLKVEPVLLHYLSRIKVVLRLELRVTTSTRLKTCLYSFTSPGGPLYPTRAVRHAAWDALDFLFPVGRYPRYIISVFFRLLYPWYWPSSCWNFILSCVRAVLYYLLGLVFSSWERWTSSKQSQA